MLTFYINDDDDSIWVARFDSKIMYKVTPYMYEILPLYTKDLVQIFPYRIDTPKDGYVLMLRYLWFDMVMNHDIHIVNRGVHIPRPPHYFNFMINKEQYESKYLQQCTNKWVGALF